MHETETALIGLGPDGVITVRIRKDAQQRLADAKQNLGAALDARGGLRRPLLVDIRESLPLDAEARHWYSGQVLVDGFTALAMVIDSSPFGRMMGNIYLRIARPGIPTRLFTDPESAKAWLIAQRQ